jgi:hypothetical protein
MSVIGRDYRVLKYNSVGGVYTTEQTIGCRRHTLSVRLGSVFEVGFILPADRKGEGANFSTGKKVLSRSLKMVADI